ncbi:MAG: type II secretion system protein [Methylotenera sp.]|nr:type II secretion system protein [Methylotenera sp.]MDP2402993.1 type II secretion system protein [Methylotenera sp.]MDP3094499.1 type II secretion system protein [Methylotenera sp.]MDZ4223533.1 type II secretion system protein [Methylotenera sp.]
MMKQKGFTLLELLVVITLLAVLAVGALVAYDGIGENAESTATAFNTASLDRAVRNYRAVEGEYPNQWDNLAHPTSGAAAGNSLSTPTSFMPGQVQDVFGSWNVAGATPAVQARLETVANDVWGTDEIQHVLTIDPTVAPGKMHNEGSNIGGALETDFDTTQFSYISVVPSVNGANPGAGCLVGGTSVSATFAGTTTGLALAQRLNAMNDAMGIERCHLVVALGFGGDAASSTSRSSASIVAAPTFGGGGVLNPAVNYTRYVGLFHVARTSSGASNVTIDESNFFARPKLIGFVDTLGNPIDVNIAAATAN